MFVTQTSLSRRTFLRGTGAALALPFLDAMVPALQAQSPAPVRLGFVYVPNGVILEQWKPTVVGANYDLPPILASLAGHQDKINILTGLAHRQADSLGDGTGDHPRASAVWLTGVHAYDRTQPGVEVRLAKTVDQYAADRLGRETQLPSLEMTLEIPSAGACDSGDCFYVNTVSWRNATTPNLTEFHPRIVFERLFGEGDSADGRRAALRARASLLDSFGDDIARLKRRVGTADRARVDQYLDTIREVERQIQRAEAGAATNPTPDLDRPVGVPAAFADHAKLLFDLQVLAFQADITRVVTFQLARELNNRTYPEIGVPDPHHPTSHHGNDPEKLAKIAKINTFHVSLFAQFLEKLKATPDGDGSLLDNTVYLYGSGLGNSSIHDHENLPILVAGGAACGMKGGRHIRYETGTPLANLHLTLLDRVGVRLDKFGDSSGRIEDLFEPVAI